MCRAGRLHSRGVRSAPTSARSTDIYTWANPGPGAVRGLSRIIDGAIGMRFSEEDANRWMRELQAQSPLYLAEYMPQLEMRDIEHTLCEFDKYERIRRGEGRPRNKFKRPEEAAHA